MAIDRTRDNNTGGRSDYGYDSATTDAQTGVTIAKRRIDSLDKLKTSPKKRLKFIAAVMIVPAYLVGKYVFHSWIAVIWTVIISLFCAAIYKIVQYKRQQEKFKFIRSTPFPSKLWEHESLKDLPLEMSDKVLIREGLRDFFLLHALKPDKPLSMPSKYVDKLWHAFILDTNNYQDYCMQAFGKILHHVPDYAFHDNSRNIRMYTYQAACRLQNINPAYPNNQVPRLFAMDTHINRVLGVAVGAISLATIMRNLSQDYISWFALITSQVAASGSGYDGYIEDAEISENGDASCGSSDGGDCGSGCGGD